MNKYMTLIIMVIFLVAATLVADSALGISTSTNIIVDFDIAPPETWIGRLNVARGMLGTFFNILTFQVEGLPVMINLLVFYPLTFGVAYMIIDIIRG